MTTLREAAQQALEAIEGVLDTYGEPLDRLSISGGGCLYCGAMHKALNMNAVLAVGFGTCTVSKNSSIVYSEPQDSEEFWEARDAEELAVKDPDQDWRIHFYAPLYEAVYQRHGENHWVLIEKGQGFA